jgi:predicted HD phosphohydrolase
MNHSNTYLCSNVNNVYSSCNNIDQHGLRFTHKLKGDKQSLKSNVDHLKSPQGVTNVKQKKVDSTFNTAHNDSNKLVQNVKMLKNC